MKALPSLPSSSFIPSLYSSCISTTVALEGLATAASALLEESNEESNAHSEPRGFSRQTACKTFQLHSPLSRVSCLIASGFAIGTPGCARARRPAPQQGGSDGRLRLPAARGAP